MENIKEKFEFEVNSEYKGMRLDKYLRVGNQPLIAQK